MRYEVKQIIVQQRVFWVVTATDPNGVSWVVSSRFLTESEAQNYANRLQSGE